MTGRVPDGHEHQALFYASDDELRQAAASVIGAPLAAGQAVGVACPDCLRGPLLAGFADHPRLHLFDHEAMYRRPASALAAQRAFVTEQLAAGAPRVQLVGEVRFGPGPASWRAWADYEAVVNVGLAGRPVTSVCLYDTRLLPAQLLHAGEQTHPLLLAGGAPRPNPAYVDPDRFLRDVPAAEPDPLEATQPGVELRSFNDLPAVRHAVLDALTVTRFDRAEREDFALAAHEVVTNALRHGRPPHHLRLWVKPGRAVTVISDSGTGVDDPLLGYRPAHGNDLSQGGMGLWLARQLCDDVHLARQPTGFNVRLRTGH